MAAVGPCGFAAQSATLAASDGGSFNFFGSTVAIDGDTAVAGAPWSDIFAPNGDLTAVDSGSAYVYVRSGNTWLQQTKLVASDEAGSRNFGYSVAISGDTIVAGAREPFGSGTGSAYVFVRSGGVWTQQAKLTASDGAVDEQFGWAVALSGDTVAIGAHQAAPGGAGAAYVFIRSGGAWSQQAKLTASDSAASDAFGSSVALVGNTALIGAPKNDQSGSDAGAAYVFTRSGTVWSQQAKLGGTDTANADHFGNAVALSYDTALVGAPQNNPAGVGDAGSAYVFTRSGISWSQQTKLTAADAATDRKFGSSVALDGDKALIGSYFSEPAGAAYAFTRSGAVWTQQAVLFAFGAAADAGYYYTVGVSGGRIVTGAFGSNRGDPYRPVAGLAFIFDSCASSLSVCQPPNLVVNNDPGQCSAAVSFSAITNVSGCPGITVTCVPASGSTFPLGTTTVTCSAIDPAFHEVSRNFTVTVQDAEAPVLALLGANPLTINAGSVFSDPGATGSDACDGILTAGIAASGAVNVNAIGSYTRNYSVSDLAGHLVSTTRTVNVVGVPVSAGTAVEVSTITDPGISVVLSGGTLQNNGAPVALPNPVVISSNSMIAGAPVTLSGAVTLANDINLVVEADTTVTGAISESGAPRTLTKDGSATLKLMAPSTHSGGVVNKMGKLQVAHDQALGTGLVRLQGGKLEATDGPRMVNNEHTIEADTEIEGTDLTIMGKTKLMGASRALTVKNMTKLDGGIEEDGASRALAKKGAGTLHLAAESKHSGGTSHEEGKLKISHDKALGTGPVTLKGGKVEAAERAVRLVNDHHLEADAEIEGTELTIAGKTKLMAADRTLVVKNQTRLEGSIEEDGVARALTKKGPGKLELAAENKHSGGTKHEEGSLQVGHDKALGTGAIHLMGGKLEATRGPRTVANEHHVEADTEISGETLEVTGKTKLKTPNAKIKVENTTKLSAPVEDDGGSRALIKIGAGTLELAAKNTHSGGTHLETGKAKISHDDAYGTGAVMLKGAKVEAAAGARKVPNEHHVEANTEILGDEMEVTGKTKLKTPNAKIKVENITKLSAPVEDDGGSRALTKAGAGTLELAAKNTHSGGTHLETGKAKISHDDAYGTGPVMLKGAKVEAAAAPRKVPNEHHVEADTEILGEALEVTGKTKLKVPNAKLKVENTTKLSAPVEDDGGSRAVTKAGAGTLHLAVKNTHSGGTHLEAGKAKISHDEAFGTGAVMLKGGKVEAADGPRKVANEVHAEADTEILGEELEITGKTKLKTANAKIKVENTTKLSAPVEDDGGSRAMTKAGAGTLHLAVKNTHSGGTHLEAGKAKVGHDEAFGTGAVMLKGGKVEAADGPRKVANEVHAEADTEILGEELEITGKTKLKTPVAKLKVENTTKLSAAVEDDGGSRALAKAGAGTLHLATENKHTGGVRHEEGSLKVGHDKALGTGPMHLTGGKVVAVDGPRTLANEHKIEAHTEIEGTDLTISGKSTLSGGDRALTVKNMVKMEGNIEDDGGARVLMKKGAGTLQLAGDNKHTGGVHHEEGKLQIAHDKALGAGAMHLKGGKVEAVGVARTLANEHMIEADTEIDGTELTIAGKAKLMAADRALVVKNQTRLEGSIEEDGTPRALTKKGPGQLELAAENKHSGGTRHEEGALQIGHDKALGAGPLQLAGGKLEATRGPRKVPNEQQIEADTEIVGDLLEIAGKTKLKTPNAKLKVENTTKLSAPVEDDGGPSVLSKAGAGTLHLAAKNTHSGGTHLEAGKAKISHDEAFGPAPVKLKGGSIETGDGPRKVANVVEVEADAEFLGDALEIAGKMALKVPNPRLKVENMTKISAPIEDDGAVSRALTKAGEGTLHLAVKNTHSGGTHLEAGKAKISHDEAFGPAPVKLKGGKIEAADGPRKVANRVDVEADAEFLGDALEIAGKTMLKVPNPRLKVENTTKISAPIEDDGAASRALTKAGEGTLHLAVKNTHSGGTHLEAGKAKISHDEAFGPAPVKLKGGKIEADGPRKVANELHAEADAEFSGGDLEITGKTMLKAPNPRLKVENTTKLSAPIEDDGTPRAVTKAGEGTLHLAVKSTHSGGTHLEAGKAKISHDEAFGTAPVKLKGGKVEADGPRKVANVVEVEADSEILGDELEITGNAKLKAPVAKLKVENTTKLSAAVEDDGGPRALAKAGSGTLHLAAENKHTGGVRHEEGSLKIGHDKALGTGPMELMGGKVIAVDGPRTLANEHKIAANTEIEGTDITMKGKATLATSPVLTVKNNVKMEGGIEESGGAQSLTKKGEGTLQVTAESKHTGGVKHEQGTLQVGHDKALGTGPMELKGGILEGVNGARELPNPQIVHADTQIKGTDITMKAKATLKANAVLTVDNKLKMEGGIDEDDSPRELSKKGPGSLELAAESKHQGGIKHQEGEIVISHDKALGPAPTVLDGGKLKVSGPRSITNDLVLEKDSEISGDKLKAARIAVSPKVPLPQMPPPPAPRVVAKAPIEVDEIRHKPLPEHPQLPPPPLKKAGPAKMEIKSTTELPTEVEEGELKLAANAKAKAPVVAKPAPKPAVPPPVPSPPPKVSGKGTAQKVEAAKGGKVKPGNSPGTLTIEVDLSFEGDGGPEPEPAIYEWDINNAAGTEGDDPGWAILSVGGSMQILATATNPIVLELVTLTLENEPGPMVNFDSQKCYSWPIVRATNGIIGFAPGAITIDTNRFTNAIDGSFSLTVENDGKDLVLHYSANHPVMTLTLNGSETMTVECHSTFVDPGATASNICSGDLTSRIATTGSVDVNQPGAYVLTYTVSDAQSSASVTRTVNVVDTTRPRLTGPAAFMHTTTNQSGDNIIMTVVATDLCDAGPVITCVPPSGSFFPPGDTVVICSAQDTSGNTSEPISVTVTVNRTPVARPLGAVTTADTPALFARAKLLGSGTDADGDPLALVVPSNSTNGAFVTANATHITYSPQPGFTGIDGFSYTLSDSRGGTATGHFEVLVVSGNLPSQNQISLTLTSAGIVLRYAGIPGHIYEIQRTTDFIQWNTIASIPAPPHGLLEYTDTATFPVAAYRTTAP